MYTSPADTPSRRARTVPDLRRMKAAGERIASLTAYDASFARVMDAAGIDAVLVGDSLGMVVQGGVNTVSVSVEDMVYHSRCVARGLQHALLIADMPFQSYASPERAIDAASALLAEGLASMVKLEGAGFVLDAIEYLSAREIPVCAHLGLTPQSVLRMGGFKVQGRDADAAQALLAQAKQVEAAGAQLLVLECVPSVLAAEITRSLEIPTIGIGAGPDCDGQILVSYDALGINSGHRRPRFVKDFLKGRDSIESAFQAYVSEVKSGAFPQAEHGYA
ncbi:3-methyl-2-oxobutanoate hydroxymethyltransferase [Arenimonas sp. GDDSR-1]|uniref:3-methyl-2-oxobutanoate hydroxymethyltransferase n=1 Tax=Arenimonas sp. GDDSR-1 TaxID=2950125 RepID=UPI0026059DAB|nr:3-methyl-2-oxobutanoate hydroxymethyltransferase [Arenimonas sp. GDDSR-1]